MQKVFVTGAGGFIGSHLCEFLAKKGCSVHALVQYNSGGSWGWLDRSEYKDSLADVTLGDVRDPGQMMSLTRGVDAIFNLAALIAIPYSYSAPTSYVSTNVGGVVNLCNAAVENGVSNFVQMSTSEVYGTADYVPIDESHPHKAQSPYSASKIAADAMAYSFWRSFNLPVKIARPFNVYGPRQSARAIIPTLITQMLNSEPKIEIGDDRPTRNFNYVSDVCEALFEIAKTSKANGCSINIGRNEEISIGDLAAKIAKILNVNVNIGKDSRRVRPKNSEVMRLRCDASRLRNVTGLELKTDLDNGLRRTIDWFSDKQNLRQYKSNIYNI